MPPPLTGDHECLPLYLLSPRQGHRVYSTPTRADPGSGQGHHAAGHAHLPHARQAYYARHALATRSTLTAQVTRSRRCHAYVPAEQTGPDRWLKLAGLLQSFEARHATCVMRELAQRQAALLGRRERAGGGVEWVGWEKGVVGRDRGAINTRRVDASVNLLRRD